MTSSSPPSAAKNVTAHQPQTAFKTTVLLLQGGGALGAYQAGVYAAMAEKNVLPQWVAGISIGAINGAIIAGNKPEERVAKLRGFWNQMTTLPPWSAYGPFTGMVEKGGIPTRRFWNQMSAGVTMTVGVPGFFAPRLIPPVFAPDGTPEATSYYDSSALKDTLQKFINFDILNSGVTRFTTSAVNVHNGNYVIFDSSKIKISPEHIMASGALPPALPSVEIDGQHYWDGGLISNTPLQWVMDDPACDALVFQVDLWPALGKAPRNMMEVATRQKEIQYSSRTRAVTNRFKHIQKMRHAFTDLYEKLPKELQASKEAQMLCKYGDYNQYNIVHLIYRAKDYEGYSKDFEFSHSTMEEHWKSGENDTRHSLSHKEIFSKPGNASGIDTFDFHR